MRVKTPASAEVGTMWSRDGMATSPIADLSGTELQVSLPEMYKVMDIRR